MTQTELPIYRTDDLYLPFKERRWFSIAKDILRREGMEDIPVYIEPGEVFNLKEHDFWKRAKIYLGFDEPPRTLGCHLMITQFGKTIAQAIHIATESSRSEVMDTIVHEIAHARCPFENHGPTWKQEYRRLRDKYIFDPSSVSDNDEGSRVPLKPRLTLDLKKDIQYALDEGIEGEMSVTLNNGKRVYIDVQKLWAYSKGKLSYDNLVEGVL